VEQEWPNHTPNYNAFLLTLTQAKNKDTVVSVPNQIRRNEEVWGKGGMAPRIHNLGTRRR